MKSLSALLLSLFAATSLFAQCQPDAITRVHANAEFEQDVGYTQSVRSGELVYISGCAASGDMATAIRQAYDSLKGVLASHGLGFEDVIKENLYTTDLDAVKREKELRKAYYGKAFPAATWVQVQRLFNADLVLEVELIARVRACKPESVTK